MMPEKCLEDARKLDNLVFEKFERDDTIQFWNEQYKISIFVNQLGVTVAGPDHLGAIMFNADRYAESAQDQP